MGEDQLEVCAARRAEVRQVVRCVRIVQSEGEFDQLAGFGCLLLYRGHDGSGGGLWGGI